jgi:hypothetical protein
MLAVVPVPRYLNDFSASIMSPKSDSSLLRTQKQARTAKRVTQ